MARTGGKLFLYFGGLDLSLVFTSDASTNASTCAITQEGQILILVLVLAASTSIKMQCA